MSLELIKLAVESLPRNEFWAFREWVDKHASDRWDREMEEDSLAGKLDRHIEQALTEFRLGQCRPLP